MKQLSFFPQSKKEFGGSLLENKRKAARPLNSKKQLHLVLKAHKDKPLRKHWQLIEQEIHTRAIKNQIKILSVSIQVDHIHLALSQPQRENYSRFIQSLTSQLSRKLGPKLWKHRPYTRVVEWGRDAQNLENYIR